MPKKGKKLIALFDKGWMWRTLNKKDFISDGKIIINVTSAGQQRIKNEKAVTKLMAMSQIIIPTLKSQFAVNTFNRTLVDKSDLEWVTGEDLIPKSVDELLALSRVELINNNIPIQWRPVAGEDLETHIAIYEKCLDTDSRNEILGFYKDAQMAKNETTPQTLWNIDNSGANLAQNMMIQQSNPNTTPMATM